MTQKKQVYEQNPAWWKKHIEKKMYWKIEECSAFEKSGNGEKSSYNY